MANQPRNKAFGDLVKQIRGERSQRQLARDTGFSHTAISDMEFGYVPKYHRLADLAEVLELDGDGRRALFATAGYTLADEAKPEGWDGDRAWIDGIRSLWERYGEVRISDTQELPLADASEEDVARSLAAIRARVCPQGGTCP
jgi:transcriptional regulator with XRE-family HTH domain